MNTTTTLPTPPPSPQTLAEALYQLAAARDQVACDKRVQKELETSSEDVRDYVAAQAAVKHAREVEKAAYEAVVTHALAAFDGSNPQIAPEVAITAAKTVTVHRHDIALLWLLCYAPEKIDINNLKGMLTAIETMGKQMPLQLRQAHVQTVVDELFTANSVLIVGDVQFINGETETVVVEIEAKTTQAARQQLEKSLLQEHGAGWNWVAEPRVSLAMQSHEHIVFAEPTTTPKPRVKRDLTHLLDPLMSMTQGERK